MELQHSFSAEQSSGVAGQKADAQYPGVLAQQMRSGPLPLVSTLPALLSICHSYVSAVSEGLDSVKLKLLVWNIMVGLQASQSTA